MYYSPFKDLQEEEDGKDRVWDWEDSRLVGVSRKRDWIWRMWLEQFINMVLNNKG